MNSRAWAANNLAARLLAEPWTSDSISAAVESVLGAASYPRRRALIARLVALGQGQAPPSPRSLTAYLMGSDLFRPRRGRTVAAVLDAPRFAPIDAFADLGTPVLSSLGDLADWLGQPPDQLDWLADARQGHRRAVQPPLQHYTYAFISKSGGRMRLVEAPKPRLKAIQRQILKDILSRVPVHSAAHGFVRGRSCLSGAQLHAAEAMVATFDLAQFFPSIGRARIHGLFHSLGYPWAVSCQLAGLCTTSTPANIFLRLPADQRPDRDVQALYGVPHLPQGAPTSPALANLLSFRLDLRLHGLARAMEANYSRYADDLAFSGGEDFGKRLGGLQAVLETIAKEEGFALNRGKTRVMPRHMRQRITGIVVNAHCNTGRAEFETLKAILYNCTRTGPAMQNRSEITGFRSHLDGRVSWVEHVNPQRGAKLRRLFDQIDWSAIPAPSTGRASPG